MHEWALAEAVLEATSSALAGRNPVCLRSVTVVLGELQAVDRGILEVALKTMLAERPFPQATYVFETELASFSCAACGRQWSLAEVDGLDEEAREAIHFLPEAASALVRCPSCGSPDFRLEKGRGVTIREITLAAGGECG
jgi:hydrogenase nickel incorporation protein HypA/HybF